MPKMKFILFISIFAAILSNDSNNSNSVLRRRTCDYDVKMKTAPIHTFCHTIRQKGGNCHTYCDIKNNSEPQSPFSESTAMATCYIIATSSITTALHAFVFMTKFSVGRIATAKVVWSAIDVSGDVYTFYQLSSGKFLDPVIYHNTRVMVGIYTFCIFGGMAIYVCIYIYWRYSHADDNKKIEAKVAVTFVTFMLEDCFESFFIYFWLEKYITSTPPYYLVIKDVTIAFVTLISLIEFIYRCHKKNLSPWKSWFLVLLMLHITVSIHACLRSVAVIYQYSFGETNRECFRVEDGKLIQKPFSGGCMRKIDYAIVVMNFVPLLSVPLYFRYAER